MRVFMTGATGAIGAALLPRLLRAGHDVVALVRTPDKAKAVESIGATAVLGDPLDRDGLISTVVAARPELILHELTALRGIRGDFRKFDQDFALTNRFRTEVTDTLIEAARAAGARRLIAQSFCGWPFAKVGGPVKTEEDPLDPNPPRGFRSTLAAIRYLEDRLNNTTDLHTCILRYGLLYGPGTGIEIGGPMIELVRKRMFPLVGAGTGVWSFVHIEDAAEATVAAVDTDAIGTFNIVDSEPAPIAEWLPYLARVIGAKPPRRVPAWLARFLIGNEGLSMMLHIRGGSNEKARRVLGWQPRYASWRTGFVEELSAL